MGVRVGVGVRVLVGDGVGVEVGGKVGASVGVDSVGPVSVVAAGSTSSRSAATSVATDTIGAGVGGALAQPTSMAPAPRMIVRSINCQTTERDRMDLLSP